MNALALKDMSKTEKLMAIEILWDDLCKQADDYESPAWHKDVLENRKQALKEGKASFSDWETAKAEIRASVL